MVRYHLFYTYIAQLCARALFLTDAALREKKNQIYWVYRRKLIHVSEDMFHQLKRKQFFSLLSDERIYNIRSMGQSLWILECRLNTSSTQINAKLPLRSLKAELEAGKYGY